MDILKYPYLFNQREFEGHFFGSTVDLKLIHLKISEIS